MEQTASLAGLLQASANAPSPEAANSLIALRKWATGGTHPQGPANSAGQSTERFI